LRNSLNLHDGHQIILISNPNLGVQTFNNLVASSIISKTGIDVDVNLIGPSQRALQGGRIIDGIVTNAASDGDSSGGALVNIQGQVIGMHTISQQNAVLMLFLPVQYLSLCLH
jgi:S1-C subfamily serine protease